MEANLLKLEFNYIQEQLSLFCKTYIGKDFSIQLIPFSNKDKVEKALQETDEASNFTIRKGNIPIIEIPDISASLKMLESNNSLSIKSLLEIGYIFKLSKDLKEYFSIDEQEEFSFSLLQEYFNKIYNNVEIQNLIFSSIIDENTIADSASKELSSIRKEKKKIEQDIKDNLNKLIHSQTYSNAIMEQIITIRNDRYVIPVKEEFRGTIKGFIHDISSSGSTLFIEPMQIFELNNKLQSIKVEENIEIEKILRNISLKIMPYTENLKNNIYLIGKLDFIFAKANFAKSINATKPIINENKFINLIKARHPLIDSNKVVPIDISIGDKYTSLIITGPNTGGKTVTLKTVGLLSAMACSGLFIPANENSSIFIFDKIFADIGDEQSIAESLSTFSAHITNIIDILNNSTDNSLILLDELGSGTDPIEGANLAISLLEYFHKKGNLTIATTHYHEVKNYALVTEGFENASSGFDLETLTPTYNFLIGVPGKSNAFEISKRLGMPSPILERAKSLVKDEDFSIEELLKNIYDDKLIIENDKNEIEKNKVQIENLRKSIEKEKELQKNEKNINLEKAKQESKNIYISTKEQANEIINELNDLYNDFKFLEDIDLKNCSDTEIANIVKSHFKKGTLSKANNLRKNYNEKNQEITTDNSNNNIKDKKFNNLEKGDKVKLVNFSEPAEILSNKSGKIQVQVGNIKMFISPNDIEKILDNSPIENTTLKKSFSKSFKSKSISPEINVIGQNVEEACFVIDKYLDDCSLAKISPVRIVHGKGSGKLRIGIHNFLKQHPHVDSFRIGTFGEGEMGVTIVDIK
ncbi:MAG: endonuclease MutS2 [Clostridia bacterium]|nr:endonuclease MutS2 [Clostridia bacterium]